MRLTSAEYQAILDRQRGTQKLVDEVLQGVEHEKDLHNAITAWCRNQHPIVPCLEARMDKRSTIGVGIHDITIWYRGQVLCLELKSKHGKLTREQAGWKLLMELQGFQVHVITSMSQFETLIAGLAGHRSSGCASEVGRNDSASADRLPPAP